MRFISALVVIALALAGATLILHLMDISWRDLLTLLW
jgi:hypothetical protein